MAAIFPVTRQDAIRAQLDTAIDLWFRECDPISAHTLACAAQQIARDVGKVYGKKGMIMDQLTKDQRIAALDVRDFFKHADRSPHKTLEFNPNLTQYHIYDAVVLFRDLYRHLSPLMTVFVMRYAFTGNGVTVQKLGIELPEGLDEAALGKLERKDFIAKVFPFVAKAAKFM